MKARYQMSWETYLKLEWDLAKHESKISDVMGNLFKVRVERDKLQEAYGIAEQDNAQRAIRVQQLEVELSMFLELKKKRKVDLGARAEVWDKLSCESSPIFRKSSGQRDEVGHGVQRCEFIDPIFI
ncbi:uncharacterized protein LOC129231728 [Uloborus diversus]|uniref:uncharacterized protein LOC129231728 n=1 Tax=Uloborus diversus TaxID=327109 RepID=UPI0024090EF9|nr:uncharacterized protein LOC129231728 [Uloborus diversus]